VCLYNYVQANDSVDLESLSYWIAEEMPASTDDFGYIASSQFNFFITGI